MDIIQLLLKEFETEAAITRKMLERVPNGHWNWQPHPKSMPMKSLTVHIAELPGWVTLALNTDGLDFAANPYAPVEITDKAQLQEVFEQSVAEGRTSLQGAAEADLHPTWTLRNGDQVYMTQTKYEVIRHALAQTIHHRAQLGVYLRLLNIPIPGSYGPSADEMNF